MERATDGWGQPPMVRSVEHQQRFFQGDLEGVVNDIRWYYRAREGTFGPFQNRESAERDLLDRIRPNRGKSKRIIYNMLTYLYRSWR